MVNVDGVKRTIRGLVALAITIAVVYQLIESIDRGASIVNFFSFFTILSNVAAVALLGYESLRDRDAPPALRGSITVYMVITGLIHAVLLAPVTADVGLTAPWVDFVVHIVAPVAVAADWLVNPPSGRLRSSVVVWWLVFPAAYLGYSLVRGPRVDWYPYPFLDSSEVGGYGGVAIYSVVILVVFILVGLFLRWWANRTEDVVLNTA
jgi:hypothetical protein